MKVELKEFFYISNLLSISRVVLTIPIAYLLILNTPACNRYALALVFLAALTDIFDGYLGRKLGQVTDLGRALDPVADKITMGVVLIFMVCYSGFPSSLVVLLVYRDLMIMSIGAIVSKKTDKAIRANFWGKLNSIVISLAALLFLAGVRNIVFTITLVVGHVTILASGASYLVAGDGVLFAKKSHRYLFRFLILLITTLVTIAALVWTIR